jgi:hypothetical protein
MHIILEVNGEGHRKFLCAARSVLTFFFQDDMGRKPTTTCVRFGPVFLTDDIVFLMYHGFRTITTSSRIISGSLITSLFKCSSTES